MGHGCREVDPEIYIEEELSGEVAFAFINEISLDALSDWSVFEDFVWRERAIVEPIRVPEGALVEGYDRDAMEGVVLRGA